MNMRGSTSVIGNSMFKDEVKRQHFMVTHTTNVYADWLMGTARNVLNLNSKKLNGHEFSLSHTQCFVVVWRVLLY